MKALTQAALFTVPSKDALPAMPKRKSCWQQSPPAISEDQLDVDIFAADPVRPQFNPINCASSVPLPPWSLHIPRGQVGRVRRSHFKTSPLGYFLSPSLPHTPHTESISRSVARLDKGPTSSRGRRPKKGSVTDGMFMFRGQSCVEG